VRRAPRVFLSPEESARLTATAADRSLPVRVRQRARILLAASEGKSNRTIARSLGVDVQTVSLWRRRFEGMGLEGAMREAPRSGRRSRQAPAISERVLYATYNVQPPKGQRWTTRSLGRYLGLNHMAVHRVWKARGVAHGGALANPDLRVAAKPSVWIDLLGVYLRPPTRAIVFGTESLPRPGASGRELLRPPLPLDVSGGVLMRTSQSDRETIVRMVEGIRALSSPDDGAVSDVRDLLILLRELEERTPASTQIHILTERWAPAEQYRLTQWLQGHPRFFLHSVPSGQSWEDGLRRFLEQWDLPTLHRASFGMVPSFAQAAVRFAGDERGENRGLVWTGATPPRKRPHADAGQTFVTDSGESGRE
jgi:transposase